MLFVYKALDQNGAEQEGTIDALNEEVAISSLQRRGLIISSIDPAGQEGSVFEMRIGLLERVSNKEVVILSRQIATLFEAQVSALRIFRLLAAEVTNQKLQDILTEVADDLQGGSSISKALAKHQKVFSPFYISMVRAGEESGKLDQTFTYLAGYLDRMYELSSKAKNALIYPAFVIGVFVIVMVLMLTLVIPKISTILTESGQEIPIYTKIVIGISSFLTNYGFLLLILMAVGGFFLWRQTASGNGAIALAKLKLSVPILGQLYQKLYLARIADNLSTMIGSGIPMIRSLEITSDVVGNAVYEGIIEDVIQDVRGGSSLADAFGKHSEMPGIVVQMTRVGEETGELGSILNSLALFYNREVRNAVDTLVNLIEPIMIVVLGLGVAVLLASVLLPIYNITNAI